MGKECCLGQDVCVVQKGSEVVSGSAKDWSAAVATVTCRRAACAPERPSSPVWSLGLRWQRSSVSSLSQLSTPFPCSVPCVPTALAWVQEVPLALSSLVESGRAASTTCSTATPTPNDPGRCAVLRAGKASGCVAWAVSSSLRWVTLACHTRAHSCTPPTHPDVTLARENTRRSNSLTQHGALKLRPARRQQPTRQAAPAC